MADKIICRFPTDMDVIHLADNLRQSDMDELAATCGLTPYEAVRLSVKASDTDFLKAWFADDQLLCIAGCSPLSNTKAAPWLLATPLMEHYQISLTRYARKGVDDMLSRYDLLSNIIDARQKTSIKWLKSLGFIFVHYDDKRQYPLWRFERRR